ncbi:hypothetical protein [Aliamphritea spongicola]|nr:hypothetical protein [Aliamphritea spongicola]
MVNASVINTGMSAEAAQQEWLENYLQQHIGERFLSIFITRRFSPSLLSLSTTTTLLSPGAVGCWG